MKIYRELEVRCASETELATLLEALDARVRRPWARDPLPEERSRGLGVDFICYTRAAAPGMPAASLFLSREGCSAKVTNIVPLEVGELSVEQYNRLLEEFYISFVEPLNHDRAQIDWTPGELSLDELLGPDVAGLLRSFSSAANKSTSASHPRDRERWNRFVIAAHEAGRDMDPDLLVSWLMQEGWPDSAAYELVVQFEQARSILADFEASRRAGPLHASR